MLRFGTMTTLVTAAVGVWMGAGVQACSTHVHITRADIEGADLRLYERDVAARDRNITLFDERHPLIGRLLGDQQFYEQELAAWRYIRWRSSMRIAVSGMFSMAICCTTSTTRSVRRRECRSLCLAADPRLSFLMCRLTGIPGRIPTGCSQGADLAAVGLLRAAVHPMTATQPAAARRGADPISRASRSRPPGCCCSRGLSTFYWPRLGGWRGRGGKCWLIWPEAMILRSSPCDE